MSPFIPIQEFSQLYVRFSDLMTEEGMQEFLKKLDSEKGKKRISELSLSSENLASFKKSIAKPQHVLFHGWIEQSKALQAFLTGNELNGFEDSSNHLKHQYIDDFRKFISPFLAKKLMRFTEEKSLSKLEIAFSYVCLLDKNHGSTVENQLFSNLNRKIEKATNECKFLKSEEELISFVKPLCDEKIMNVVNSLSRASYSYKLGYIDNILSVLKYKSCTPRFANWILKELAQIDLNHEHVYKVKDLRKELKSGELRVRNHGRGRTPIKWSKVVTFALIFLISGLTFWIVKYKPFSGEDDPLFNNDTSFMQFSKEERKKIDSLLLSMNGNVSKDDLTLDQGIPLIGTSDQLTIRKTFTNKTLERIYQDFVKDAESREGKLMDSCTNSSPFVTITDTKDLASSIGKVEVMVKNESEYDAIIVVSQERTGGNTYTMLLKKGETQRFKMNRYDYLMVAPGNNFQSYSPPSNVAEENLPSDKFKHYFCEIDFNYRNSVNSVYQLIHLQNGKTKFLLMGDKGSYFHLIDINSVLESI